MVLAATLAHAPLAQAQDAMLGMAADGLILAEQPLARAYAACLNGGGRIEPVATALAPLGLTREDDGEMEMTVLFADDQPFMVTFYDGGAICDVSSESIGTAQAMMQLSTVGGLVGYEAAEGTECTALRIKGILAEVTSSGNDPVCFDDATSNVRFSFGE
jgi:hypothetical protein